MAKKKQTGAEQNPNTMQGNWKNSINRAERDINHVQYLRHDHHRLTNLHFPYHFVSILLDASSDVADLSPYV